MQCANCFFLANCGSTDTKMKSQIPGFWFPRRPCLLKLPIRVPSSGWESNQIQISADGRPDCRSLNDSWLFISVAVLVGPMHSDWLFPALAQTFTPTRVLEPLARPAYRMLPALQYPISEGNRYVTTEWIRLPFLFVFLFKSFDIC